MMPSLRALDAVITHIENFRFGCSARKLIISPRNGFGQEMESLPMICKKNLSRDTKLAVRRELTISNSSLTPALRRQKSAKLVGLKVDRRRTSPDRYSGQAISDLDFFTLSHPLHPPLGKTADYPIPTRKSEDSPRTASAGETSPRKKVRQYDPCGTRDVFRKSWLARTSSNSKTRHSKASNEE